MNNSKSKFIKHTSCPECGSSDGLAVYSDGGAYCWAACNKFINLKEYTKNTHLTEQISNTFVPLTKDTPSYTPSVPKSPLTPIDLNKVSALTDRGLTEATCKFYNIQVNPKGEQMYPYFSLDGKQHKANKFRTAGQKGFIWQGDSSKTALFGQQLFEAGSSKQITLVEGELDAASVYQMTGSKFPVLSVKNAATARKDVSDNYEYLNAFKNIVICFDNDKFHKKADGTPYNPGQEAAEQVASMFELGKVRILCLRDAKDANDYLKKGWGERFQKEWWDAKQWSPVGIQHAKDCWEDVLLAKTTKYDSIDYPWEGLNKLTYGLRPSELVTITANPKVGKTSVLREVVFNIIQKIMEKESEDSRRVGVMFLEEPKKDTLLGLMSLTANKPLHLPDILENTSEEELKKYFDSIYGNDKVILWNHFGSNDIATVLNYIRYMSALGCKYILLDHLSIIVSDQSGDERKQLDEITTKIKTLTMELGICVIVVIHQNRQGQIRGTAGVEQLSNIVIKLYRDMLSDDEEVRNVMKVVVEMNRFSGKTGPACLLKYDPDTSRLVELPDDSLREYLDKTKKKTSGENEDGW